MAVVAMLTVAEQDLDDPCIDAAFQKSSSRIAMAKRMRADRPCDARRAKHTGGKCATGHSC